MKIQSFKRIIAEDYESKDRTLIQKLAFSINTFADDVTSAISNKLSIEDNFNIIKKDLTVSTNSTGALTVVPTVKTGLGRLCDGCTVIKVTNSTNSTTYPTGSPWVSFSENTTGLITINNITNLPANSIITLKLLLF